MADDLFASIQRIVVDVRPTLGVTSLPQFLVLFAEEDPLLITPAPEFFASTAAFQRLLWEWLPAKLIELSAEAVALVTAMGMAGSEGVGIACATRERSSVWFAPADEHQVGDWVLVERPTGILRPFLAEAVRALNVGG